MSDRLASGFSRCPKCGHGELPADQSLPAACPACGVILAKVAATRRGRAVPCLPVRADRAEGSAVLAMLLHVPERVEGLRWWLRVLLLASFTVWGLVLIGLDHRTGNMGSSFLHGPLLVFHEAGHVLFSPFGLWLLGVSLLDVAPYMHDALDPRLVLLSGSTGEDGRHDWI